MKPLQGLVVAVAIAAVAGCFYLIVEAGRRIYESIGPSKMVAAADGSLYVASHGFIHVFGPDGRRRGRFDLDAAGVTRTPSDFAVHEDGRIVVADPDGSHISRCTISPPHCEKIDPRLTRIRLQKALPLNSVKVAIDEKRERYYFSDNAGHRVVATRFDGARIAQSPLLAVHYPNQLALVDGTLRVVDTNNRRIVVFDVSGDRLAGASQMPLVATGIVRPGREWPFDALRMATGETWTLLAVDGMKDADLIIFDPAGIARRRIDLGADSDPFDIEPWRDRVLVADATNYRIDAVTADGAVGAAPLDREFAAELARAKQRPEVWRSVRTAAQVAILLVPILAIAALWKLGAPIVAGGRVPPPMPAVEAAPLRAQIEWIEMDDTYPASVERRIRRALLPMVLALIALMALFFYWVREISAGDPHFTLLMARFAGLCLLALVLLPVQTWFVRRLLKGYRIGASVDGLHYELPWIHAPIGDRRKGKAPWRDVYFDGRRLLAGRRALVVANFGFWMFDPARIARYIDPYVPPANHISTARLLMKQAGVLPWIVLALALAVLVFAFFLI